MELTGALNSRFPDWELISREFFPGITPQQLYKKHCNLLRTAPSSHPILLLEKRRPPKLESQERSMLTQLQEHEAEVEQHLKRLFAAPYDGIMCSGCNRQVCGTLLLCRHCPDFRYCVGCWRDDTLAHEWSHWHEIAQGECNGCKGEACAENTGGTRYCLDCMFEDPLDLFDQQWTIQCKRPDKGSMRAIKTILGVKPKILKEYIWNMRLHHRQTNDESE